MGDAFRFGVKVKLLMHFGAIGQIPFVAYFVQRPVPGPHKTPEKLVFGRDVGPGRKVFYAVNDSLLFFIRPANGPIFERKKGA